MTRTALKRALPALVLAAAVLVPFRDKAFTIDDHVFMFMAEHAVVDPLHPSAFDMVWGDARGRLGLASGPVMAWLLVPSALAGGSEALVHLVQLAMLWLAIVSTVALAIRLGVAPARAGAAGLLLACTPAALGMAGTAMPDVSAMALGVAGLERLLAWRDERRLPQAFLAAAALALAPLTRPHLVLLLGIGALLLHPDVFAPRKVAFGRAWAPLVVAPLLTLAVALLTRDPAPSAPSMVAATASVTSGEFLVQNLVAIPIHWALVLPLTLPWVILRARSVVDRWWIVVAGAAASAFVLGTDGQGIALAGVTGVSLGVLWAIGAEAWKRRDSVQVTLGTWLLVAVAVVPYPHLPSKYLLASAPAAAILVARELGAVRTARAWLALGATCALGLALGVAILRADAAFAGLGRRAAAELIAPNVARGQRVWFTGHWGFQWYAQKAGGRPVTIAPPFPERGDLLVTSDATEPGPAVLEMLAQRYPRATLLGKMEDGGPGGRVMDASLGAGFFSQAWGYLPWAWGDGPLDTFALWRLEERR